jgi:hypothetical protein
VTIKGLGTCLRFQCPVCDTHGHLVPYVTGTHHGPLSNGANSWANPSGSTVEDITLSPSYVCEIEGCRLHCFIRAGVVQVLSDSSATRGTA